MSRQLVWKKPFKSHVRTSRFFFFQFQRDQQFSTFFLADKMKLVGLMCYLKSVHCLIMKCSKQKALNSYTLSIALHIYVCCIHLAVIVYFSNFWVTICIKLAIVGEVSTYPVVCLIQYGILNALESTEFQNHIIWLNFHTKSAYIQIIALNSSLNWTALTLFETKQKHRRCEMISKWNKKIAMRTVKLD